jgi:hypothetical protein
MEQGNSGCGYTVERFTAVPTVAGVKLRAHQLYASQVNYNSRGVTSAVCGGDCNAAVTM